MPPTKTVKIDPDALPVIAAMEWTEHEGKTLGILTCGQLDRAMYQAVNKGLDALNGKWNKKAGGHIFAIDPRPQLAEMLGTGTITVEKDGFFPTPKEVVLSMLDMVTVREPILEPSAGDGAICDVLREQGYTDIVAIERNEHRQKMLVDKGYRVHGNDFLEYRVEHPTIIMNPPFEQSQDIAHISHAFDNCLEPGGGLVSVVSEGPFFRDDSKAKAFRELVDLYGCSEQLPEGAFKVSGTMVRTRLVYLCKPGAMAAHQRHEFDTLPLFAMAD